MDGANVYKKFSGHKLNQVRIATFKLAKAQKGQRALDIGCGRGEIIYALAKKGLQVTGVDFSPSAVELSLKTCARFVKNGQVKIKQMNANNLKFPDNSFDLIIASDVVEHLSDRDMKKFAKESYRVLAPAGKLIIHTLPTVNYKRIGQYLVKWYFDQKKIAWNTLTTKGEAATGHVNIHSKKSLEDYLSISFGKNVKVFYGPANPSGILKKIIGAFGLWQIFSHHLWAEAKKYE